MLETKNMEMKTGVAYEPRGRPLIVKRRRENVRTLPPAKGKSSKGKDDKCEEDHRKKVPTEEGRAEGENTGNGNSVRWRGGEITYVREGKSPSFLRTSYERGKKQRKKTYSSAPIARALFAVLWRKIKGGKSRRKDTFIYRKVHDLDGQEGKPRANNVKSVG